MPIDYNRYPPNWKKEIVPRILARADYKCECCGVARLSYQVRGCKKVWKQIKSGKKQVSRTFHYNTEDEALQDGCTAVYQTKIILTIAHLDHDETNWDVSDERLKAMCQLCHLQYDAAEKYRRMTERGLKRIETKFIMDLSQQLTNYFGLQTQVKILTDEKEAVQNECSALFSSIASKLLQENEESSFEDPVSLKYNIQEGLNVLSINNKMYSFDFDTEDYRIRFLKELNPIKIP